MADRGRGRSRGRGRGQDDRKQGPGQQQQQQPPQQPQTSAWSRRPGPPQPQPGPSSQTPYSRSSAPAQSTIYPKVKGIDKSAGRATQRLGPKGDGGPGHKEESIPEAMEVSGETSGGDAAALSSQLGRGAMRGRRMIPSTPENIQTRPENLITKQGNTGSNVMLQANYFKLLATTDWCLYQYRVDFAPEEDRTAVRKGLLKLHREILGAYVFDGTVMYSSRRLQDKMEIWSRRTSDEHKIRITIRLVGEMEKVDQRYLQFFNIIMRKCLALLNLQLVGRDYFDAHSKVEVRDFRLELWPGYLTSIRQHEKSILMCAEIIHKVMRQQTLLDILNDCYKQDKLDYKTSFENQVIGLVVLTDYNNNTYRISDVDFDSSPDSTFQLRTGEKISYREYYRNKYQISITNASQPMLVTRLKPRERRAGQAELVYLVPELCRATGLTDAMRDNFHLMRTLAEYTRVSPAARIDKLMVFNRRLRGNPSIVRELDEWNLHLDEKLVDVPARFLQPEKIVLGSGRTVSAGQFADWTRELHNKPLYNIARLTNWVVICMGRMRRDVERFIQTLKESASGMGFRIDNPRLWDIVDDRSNTYSDTLERVMSTSNPELIFCVVSNNRADRYSAIKKKCTHDRPVASQVFLAKNLTNKGIRSIATKVAIQLNCKLGGAPWSVELPPINLMVVGYDVCHDPADKSRDFGAMVASLDRSLTRYYSAVAAHTTGEELSDEFGESLEKAVLCYRQVNKILPSHIVIYRDGVGEGQVPYVYKHEVDDIKAKLNKLYGDPSTIKLAFVIVTKRINTRLFYNQNNPPPGTVVDDIVTNPLRYDFFIVSQSVRQGTVTPCAYNVIADSTGWKADQMQRMTYKLCHMYYNWSGTVRVPAPCQYAHKLAFLVAQFVRRPPSARMQSLLYYL
ncbi:aubergine isoform X1 [Apis mellifera caucasica]|uniref:Aubergine isoform X1 n=2 Tax=Apis mellifera TaxID=7460 RepID=A0A7M7SRK0_APIME|nr:aubergine isoform X1 [Apis mellifera]KAG6794632.1 aubergine isoform X1 [Apis mellifera caucasica]KAG9429497.1 aubergine isoform X1 [Apis mellifera carnica]|eukprot:XP_026300661.1 aubergine isoform X1 [Apis mellifera]